MTEDHQADLFGNPFALPPTVKRTLDAAVEIMQDPPEKASYLHAILCQVGMPRKQTPGRVFERRNGAASMLLEAGRLWTKTGWQDQPLPYGSRPRLIMVHISSEAIRTRQRKIEIGNSAREFMLRLGIQNNGGARGGYKMFKQQMESLAACRLSLGFTGPKNTVTLDAKPISRFDAWMPGTDDQPALWPGELELSHDFYTTLLEHAVPLDPRALGALKDSALAIDIYSWLAHRLYRVSKGAAKVSWANLSEQFGQEYKDSKDFKKTFRPTLKRVLAVYPDARVTEVIGGLMLRTSRPPILQTKISLSGTQKL